MSHPTRRLDDAVHQRTRLGILAVLAENDRADFTYLRTILDLIDGNLSRNLTRLHEAGLVAVEKQRDGARQRTWISITPPGRAALDAEVATLRDIIARVENGTSRGWQARPAADPA